MEEKTYDVEVECANCGASSYKVDIPMGSRWDIYLLEIEYTCKYCGCSGCMTRC